MKNNKEWTVMIYMVGDNNLSIDMVYALEELQMNGFKYEDDNINLFVYYENNSPDMPPIYCDFSDINNPVYKYSNTVEHKFSLEKNTELQNCLAINQVLDFVDWCVNKVEISENDEIIRGRKADNYSLIFSGHTMGFLTMGLLKEETTNVSMTMPSLKKGLEIIRDEIIEQKLAILGFDSCVMSMFEIGQQFYEISDTMIASEGSIPNAGWSYGEIVGSLVNEDSNREIKEIAADFVKKYITKQSRYSIGGVSVDMSAWDFSKLENLKNEFGKFAELLLKCFADEKSVIYRQMKRIILQTRFECQSYMYDQNVDIGDFCSLLINELESLKYETMSELDLTLQELCQSAKSVISAIEECVILSGYSGGEYQYSTGISIFLPWSLSAYQVSFNDYSQLSFIQDTKAGRLWNEFLQKYLSEVSLRSINNDPRKEVAISNNSPSLTPQQSIGTN